MKTTLNNPFYCFWSFEMEFSKFMACTNEIGRSVTSVGAPYSGKTVIHLSIHQLSGFFCWYMTEVMMQSDTSSTWTIVANSFRSIYCMAADTLHGVNYLGSQLVYIGLWMVEAPVTDWIS